MPKVAAEIEVPVAVCAKCGETQPFSAVGRPGPDGRVNIVVQPPWKPLIVAGAGVLLCEPCTRYVRKALEAVGVEFPPDSKPS